MASLTTVSLLQTLFCLGLLVTRHYLRKYFIAVSLQTDYTRNQQNFNSYLFSRLNVHSSFFLVYFIPNKHKLDIPTPCILKQKTNKISHSRRKIVHILKNDLNGIKESVKFLPCIPLMKNKDSYIIIIIIIIIIILLLLWY